jgi:hypothetical protein
MEVEDGQGELGEMLRTVEVSEAWGVYVRAEVCVCAGIGYFLCHWWLHLGVLEEYNIRRREGSWMN